MAFKRWTDLSPEAKAVLRPDLGIRSWDQISEKEKENIWLYFTNKGWFAADDDTEAAVRQLNEENKAASLCSHIQGHGGPHFETTYGGGRYPKHCCRQPAQLDFQHISYRGSQNVFYELLSIYIPILERDILDKRKADRFRYLFNDISNQFGLNVLIGGDGFILRQDEKITEEIHKPVLALLSDKKWDPVNRDLNDATIAYLKGSKDEYSRSITLTVSALQGFLQIIAVGRTGKGDIGELIKRAQANNLIPSDPFTKRMFTDIESVLMQERQDKGDPHPKKEYANEKSARLLINLTMVFMQHCLQPSQD